MNLADALELHPKDRVYDPKYLGPEFYQFAATKLAAKIKRNANGKVVIIVTGFFGKVPGSLLTGMGRGYSDLTAGLVAVGMGANELVIWKEVDGIYTADPLRVPQATQIPRLSPAEAAELTHYGAEVIHPFTTRLVSEAGIAIRIRSIHSAKRESLIIISTPRQGPIAVSAKETITLIHAAPRANMADYEFLAMVFGLVRQHAVPIDLVSTSRSSLTMALPKQPDATFLEELGGICHLTVHSGMSILSVVGEGMRCRPGTSSRFFSVLGMAAINVAMISQGASELNISCVIDAADTTAALQAVHAGMITESEN